MYFENNFSGIRDIYQNSMRKNKLGNEIEKGYQDLLKTKLVISNP